MTIALSTYIVHCTKYTLHSNCQVWQFVTDEVYIGRLLEGEPGSLETEKKEEKPAFGKTFY